MKTTYKQLKDKQYTEYNNFPIGAAFSNNQLEEMKTKLNVTDNSELLSLGYSVYIRKSDREAYREMTTKQENELKQFLETPEGLKDALKYELGNHEYCITQDPTDTLNSLSLVYSNLTDEQKDIFQQAKKEYLAQCEW